MAIPAVALVAAPALANQHECTEPLDKLRSETIELERSGFISLREEDVLYDLIDQARVHQKAGHSAMCAVIAKRGMSEVVILKARSED